MRDLSNKVALVTGANSGIGEATVHQLAQQGCDVIISGRRENENNRVAEDLRKTYDVSVFAVAADVSEESACAELVRATIAMAGRLDILVNNAGIGNPGVRIAESKTATLERLMKVNFFSAYWLSREVFQYFEKQPVQPDWGLRGAIINVSSVLGLDAWEGSGLYAASKHAMTGLTRALAEEGKEPRIRVTSVCPALVKTAMTAQHTEEGEAGEDWISPGDIAQTIGSLLSLSAAAWPREIAVNRRGQ